MRAFLSISALAMAFGAYIPYGSDVLRGKALPARATRLMIFLLLGLSIIQQHNLGSSWTLTVTIGETVGSFGILVLSIRRGVGGMHFLDIACYVLLVIGVLFWWYTRNALFALYGSIFTDLIAFTPTLVKTWYRPKTETPIFYIIGGIAPLVGILGGGVYSYAVILFPAYLVLVNLLEIALIAIRPRILKMIED